MRFRYGKKFGMVFHSGRFWSESRTESRTESVGEIPAILINVRPSAKWCFFLSKIFVSRVKLDVTHSSRLAVCQIILLIEN